MRIVTLVLFFLFSMLYGCGEFGFLLDSSEPEGLQQYVEGAPLPVMVKVPAGQFQMGCISGKNCNEEEGPVHTVNIRSFEMSVTEVTFEQWDACIADGGCSHIPDDRGWGRGDLPVINVSWDDIQSYLSWLNKKTQSKYRLPSEAEWEYAARANSKTVYSWGDAIGVNKANCGGCGSPWDDKQSSPVGSFEENAFGLYDVHGNVWEWAEDCKNKNYIGAPTDRKSVV